MTCVEAIEKVLRESSRSMRAREIAEEINRRALYVRRDGAPLPPYQVSSIAHGAAARFDIEDGLIGLAEWRRGRGVDLDEKSRPVAVLIGCVSRKQPTAQPAKDLYRTELFRRRRGYAEASGLPWYIISAKHGLLDPEQLVAPYNLRVTELDRRAREALSEQIADALEARFGSLAGRVFEVHAGQEYLQMLGIGLRRRFWQYGSM